MKAAIFDTPGTPVRIDDVSDPEPGEGEVVIKVSRCGVCGTDLEMTGGHGQTLPPGSTLGHEYGGEVVAVGSGVDTLKCGDNIGAFPIVGCGSCDGCATGLDVFCPHMKTYAAGMAQYARVSAWGATKLPSTVGAPDSALIEPLAVARRAARLIDAPQGSKALILGPGPIGLAVAFWLQRSGVRDIAVVASSRRRHKLAELMGVEHFIVDGDDAPAAIHDALGGLPDVVFDAAGKPGVLGRAIELVRPQGHILSLSYCMQPDPIVPGLAMFKDVTIRFSVVYTRDDYKACADALSDDADRVRPMVTDTVTLDGFPQAFEELRDPASEVGKLLVDPWAK
jgi:(R,R)-butanediol dehydrogenase/meso-butanediol dehydrogenase/diacetyl reductase